MSDVPAGYYDVSAPQPEEPAAPDTTMPPAGYYEVQTPVKDDSPYRQAVQQLPDMADVGEASVQSYYSEQAPQPKVKRPRTPEEQTAWEQTHYTKAEMDKIRSERFVQQEETLRESGAAGTDLSMGATAFGQEIMPKILGQRSIFGLALSNTVTGSQVIKQPDPEFMTPAERAVESTLDVVAPLAADLPFYMLGGGLGLKVGQGLAGMMEVSNAVRLGGWQAITYNGLREAWPYLMSTVVGWGLPAFLRKSFEDAQTRGEVKSFSDYLGRLGDATSVAAKEGLLGAGTAAAGTFSNREALKLIYQTAFLSEASALDRGDYFPTGEEVTRTAATIATAHFAFRAAGRDADLEAQRAQIDNYLKSHQKAYNEVQGNVEYNIKTHLSGVDPNFVLMQANVDPAFRTWLTSAKQTEPHNLDAFKQLDARTNTLVDLTDKVSAQMPLRDAAIQGGLDKLSNDQRRSIYDATAEILYGKNVDEVLRDRNIETGKAADKTEQLPTTDTEAAKAVESVPKDHIRVFRSEPSTGEKPTGDYWHPLPSYTKEYGEQIPGQAGRMFYADIPLDVFEGSKVAGAKNEIFLPPEWREKAKIYQELTPPPIYELYDRALQEPLRQFEEQLRTLDADQLAKLEGWNYDLARGEKFHDADRADYPDITLPTFLFAGKDKPAWMSQELWDAARTQMPVSIKDYEVPPMGGAQELPPIQPDEVRGEADLNRSLFNKLYKEDPLRAQELVFETITGEKIPPQFLQSKSIEEMTAAAKRSREYWNKAKEWLWMSSWQGKQYNYEMVKIAEQAHLVAYTYKRALESFWPGAKTGDPAVDLAIELRTQYDDLTYQNRLSPEKQELVDKHFQLFVDFEGTIRNLWLNYRRGNGDHVFEGEATAKIEGLQNKRQNDLNSLRYDQSIVNKAWRAVLEGDRATAAELIGNAIKVKKQRITELQDEARGLYATLKDAEKTGNYAAQLDISERLDRTRNELADMMAAEVLKIDPGSDLRFALEERYRRLGELIDETYNRPIPDKKQMIEQLVDAEMKKLFGLKNYASVDHGSGDFIVSGKNADGKQEWFRRYETLKEAKAKVIALREAYPEADTGLAFEFFNANTQYGKRWADLSYEGMLNFEGLIKEVQDWRTKQGNAPLTREQIDSLKYMMYDARLKSAAGGAFARRRAIAGVVEGNPIAAAHEYFERVPYALIRRLNMDRVTDAIEQLPKEYQPAARDNLEYVLGRRSKESNWSYGVRTFGYTWFLGMKPAFGLWQYSQRLVNTIPWLMKETGSIKDASAVYARMELAEKKLIVGYADYWLSNGGDFYDYLKSGESSLPGTQLDVLRLAIERGAIDTIRGQDIWGTGGVMSKIGKWSGYIANITERGNRIHSFLSFADVGERAGLSGEDLYDYARQNTDAIHYQYSLMNRPKIGQGNIKAILYLFQSYPLNQFHMYKELWQADKRAFTTGMAIQHLVYGASGGLLGWAGWNAIDIMMNLIDPVGWPLRKEEVKAKIRDYKVKGIGVGAAGLRWFTGGMWAPTIGAEGSYVNQPNFVGLPAMLSWANQSWKAIQQLREGKQDIEVRQWMRQVSPSALKGILSQDFTKNVEGMERLNEAIIKTWDASIRDRALEIYRLAPTENSKIEHFAAMFGASTPSQKEYFEMLMNLNRSARELSNRKAHMNSEYAKADRRGDNAAMQRIENEADKWDVKLSRPAIRGKSRRLETENPRRYNLWGVYEDLNEPGGEPLPPLPEETQ